MILAQPGMLRNFGCSDRLGNMRQYIVLCFFDMGIPRVVFFRFADFFAEFACGIFDDWRDFGGLSGKEQPVQAPVRNPISFRRMRCGRYMKDLRSLPIQRTT